MLWNAKNGSVSIDGTQMHYVSFGYGEKSLILIPGLSDGLATVKGKALMLAKPYELFFERYTVYLFSRKDDLSVACSIQDMATDQVRAMRILGIRRASILGVSQGGMIAQLLAASEPELVEKLVLAVTAPWANEKVQACVNCWIALAEQGNHKALMIDTAEKSYSMQFLKKYRLLYPALGMVGKPANYDRFLINARSILDFDAREDLQHISCPTLILGGEDDQIVGAEASRELCTLIAGSAVYLYPGLGHAAYEEAPDFYPRVFRFLEA